MSPSTSAQGYAMAALLMALSVMSIILSIALPVWQTFMQREREAELVFRGEQYVHAIDLFSRRTGGFPTSLETLRTGRYIRRLYKDPITGGDFRPVFLGQVSVPGVGVGVGQAGQRAGGPAGARAGSPAARGVPGSSGGTPGGMAQGSSAAGSPARGTGAGPGQIGAGAVGPIIGVVSTSTGDALRLYNGRGKYNEWLFVTTAATQQPGAPAGSGTPGARVGGPPPAGRRGFPPGTPPPSRGAPLPGMPMRGVGPMRQLP